MKVTRKIIEIDEQKCTGCGLCINACAEAALEIVDGKARMAGEIFCDGLGACLDVCPEDALHIVEREAEDFDEGAVHERLRQVRPPAPAPKTEPCGCPSLMAHSGEKREADAETRANLEKISGAAPAADAVPHWPLKLQLLNPQAPFLQGRDLLLVSDCAAYAAPQFAHSDAFRNHAVALACPKFEDHDAQISRIAEIIKKSGIQSVTVVIMEVPCCGDYMNAARKAIEISGVNVPLSRVVVDRHGAIIEYKDVTAA
jgi:ferredoxin